MSAIRVFGHVLVALGVTGCGSDPLVLTYPAEVGEFRSVVRVENYGEEVRAYLEPFEPGRDVVFESLPEDGVQFGALFYRLSPEEMGFSAARVFPSDGAHRTPDATFLSTDVDLTGVSWGEVERRDLRPWMHDHQLPNECYHYGAEQVTVPARDGENVLGMARVDDNTALVALAVVRLEADPPRLENPRLIRVKRDGGRPSVTELSFNGEPTALSGGFRSGSKVWFGGFNGELASIDAREAAESLTVTLKPEATLPTTAGRFEKVIRDIDGDPERDDDIFALTIDGSVLHYDGDRIRVQGRLIDTSTNTQRLTFEGRSVRWVESQTAIANSPTRDLDRSIAVFRVGEEPVLRPLPPFEREGARVRWIGDLDVGPQGIFVPRTFRADGAQLSEVWMWDEDEWRLYSEPELGLVSVIARQYETTNMGITNTFSGRLGDFVEDYNYKEGILPEQCLVRLSWPPLDHVVLDDEHTTVVAGLRWGGGDEHQLLWLR